MLTLLRSCSLCTQGRHKLFELSLRDRLAIRPDQSDIEGDHGEYAHAACQDDYQAECG